MCEQQPAEVAEVPHELGYDLEAEVAKVQAELVVFRNEYLPVFLDRPPFQQLTSDTPASIRAFVLSISSRLSVWQQAVDHLSEALPPITSGSVLRVEDFQDFMFQEATPAFTVSNNGVRWNIELCMTLDSARGICPFLDSEGHARSKEAFLAVLPRIKAWLLSLPLTEKRLLDGLCALLPIIADADPSFARLALDLETWYTLMRTNRNLSEDVRQKSLQRLDCGYFSRVVNNALLHVFGSLANNHFGSIRDYLGHPCLYGAYTGLMPHYVFALLFQKVSILRQLVAEDDFSACVTGKPPIDG